MEVPGGPGVVGAIKAGTNISITADGVISANAGGQPIGTVTSFNISGGLTGLTYTGGPITTAGVITLGGILNIANGGTGATSAAQAQTTVLPPQSGRNGDFLGSVSNVARWAPIPARTSFPAGTKILFYQPAPSAGYVIDTSLNDVTLRIVNNNGGGTGGGAPFSAVLNNRAVPIVDHGHNSTNGGGHTHSYQLANNQNIQHGQGGGKTPGDAGYAGDTNTASADAGVAIFSASQSGQPTSPTINFDVQYIDVIVCTKT
jgi:hypothetical protein